MLYPSSWLGCLAEDPALESALARSYNTFMAAQCNASGGHLFFGAIVPFRSPSAAVDEIRRVRELGSAVSVFVRGIEWDMPLSHPSFWPIYAEAERQGLVMAVHTGFGSPTINHMFDGLPPLPGELPFIPPRGGFLVSGLLVQFAFVSVLRAGLLEEFPNLRWAFLEVGSEWLPSALRAARMGPKASRILENGRISISCEPDEDLTYLIHKYGVEWPIVASDMPHTDDFHHDRPEDVFRSRGDLSDEVLEKLLRGNASRLYGI